MRSLALDFVATPHKPMLAWLLLLAGALTMGVAADRYADARGALDRLELQVARLQRQSKLQATTAGRFEQSARQQSQLREQALLAEIARPRWQPALVAVEQAYTKEIAVLSLNQEAAARRLRIGGEARSIEDVLAFSERLRASGIFAEVMLGGHENKKSTGIDVIGFTLLTVWQP